MASTRPVKELVFEVLEHSADQRDAALEELCRRHPDLADALRQRLDWLRGAGLVADREEADRAPPEVPERLGDFTILDHIGTGGMGVVYRARQESLGREVALKLVRPEQLYFAGARERFEREVAAVARLQHAGVVPVYAVGEEQGVPYFAMELVQGVSLADALAQLRGRAPSELRGADLDGAIAALGGGATGEERAPLFAGSWPTTCLRIVREVAEALEHAHRAGVLHRDVKPSNVMITRGGRVMLVDFGLSSDEGAEHVTRTGSQAGSLPYMAPEHLAGTAHPSRRTDVYGLGVLLYELLSLELPFHGASSGELRQRVLDSRPVPLRERNPEVSWEAETVCLVAMDRDAARRYASAEEMARDLSNVLENRPLAARRASALLRARRWVQRHPAASVALGLGLLALIGGPAFWAWREHLTNVRVGEKNVEIRQTNEKLLGALGLAQEEQAHAESNLDDALAAVERMLTRVADEKLDGVPRLEELRRELYEDALEFQRGLVLRRSDDPRLRRELALAQYGVGKVLDYLGRLGEAQAALREGLATLDACLAEGDADERLEQDRALVSMHLGKVLTSANRFEEAEPYQRDALEVLERLHDEQPEEGAFSARLSDVLIELAVVERSTGRAADAEQTLQRAIDLALEHVERAPEDRPWRQRLVQHLKNLSSLLLAEGRFAEAEERLADAVGWAEDLARESPDDWQLAYELAITSHQLAWVFLETGREAEAEDLWRAQRERMEQLVRDLPQNRYLQDALYTTLSNQAYALVRLERYDEAEPLSARALEVAESLAASHPGIPKHDFQLSAAQHHLANLLRNRGEYEAALELLEEALPVARALTESYPDKPAYVDGLARLRGNRAEVLIQTGRCAEAVEDLHSMLEADDLDARVLFGIAALFSECSSRVLGDESLAEDERFALSDGYVEEGIDAMRRSVDAGFRDASHLKRKDLDPLRAHPAFEELAGRVRSGL